MVLSKTRNYGKNKRNCVEKDVEYYGVLTDIIELDYHNQFKAVLFRGDWADPTEGIGVKKDDYGFRLVNFSHLTHTGQNIAHEPFVLSSQVQQVFYVQDPIQVQWHVAIKTKPRYIFAFGHELEDESGDRCVPFNPQLLDDTLVTSSLDSTWVRTDVTEEILLDV